MVCLQEDSGEASPTAAHQAVLDSNTSSHLGADLAEALPLLCGNALPQALQAAFQLADPGFAAPIAQALQVLSTQLMSSKEHAGQMLMSNACCAYGASSVKVPCMYASFAFVWQL